MNRHKGRQFQSPANHLNASPLCSNQFMFRMHFSIFCVHFYALSVCMCVCVCIGDILNYGNNMLYTAIENELCAKVRAKRKADFFFHGYLPLLWVMLKHFWMITMWMDLELASNIHGAHCVYMCAQWKSIQCREPRNRVTLCACRLCTTKQCKVIAAVSTCNIFMRFVLWGYCQAFNRIYRREFE